MIKKIVGGFIIFAILLFPLSPLKWISNEALASEWISEDEVWSGEIEIDENFFVEEGATLTVEKGSRIEFTENFLSMYIEGTLDVRGTIEEPVVFSGPGGEKGFAIKSEGNGYIRMNNAEISGGGNGIYLVKNNRYISTAMASGHSGALTFNGGRLEVQNTDFYDNYLGIKINQKNSREVKVNRSSFENNQQFIECEYAVDCDEADFRYNWWGNENGPTLSGYDQEWLKYEKIYGNIKFEPFRYKKEFRDPVVIVPGIMGSWEKNGQWQLDPILHTYENLYESLIGNGYVEGETLFTFPYQWRDSNNDNAQLLGEKIAEIKNQNNWPKVDIVAHSMGGLLARAYIQSANYQNDIDQLITLGTPHLGAPESYPKWEAGDWSLSFSNLIVEYLFKQEAEEADFDDIFDYIQERPISSVQELLPVYDYLFDEDAEAMRIYPENYPANEFLELLNNDESSKKLKEVEFSKIIGAVGDEESTVAGFKVIYEDFEKYWEHGYPNGFNFLGDQGIIQSDGDGTVPIYSVQSENIYSDRLITLDSSHSALPTTAQGEIFKILAGKEIGEKVERGLIKSILLFNVFSPIDIQVEAPDGKKIGKDFETGEYLNEINLAFYSGFEGDEEFITIPNPIKGKYKIRTQATGSGDYEIKVVSMKEDAETGKVEEKVKSFEGTMGMIGEEKEALVNVDQQGEI